MTWYKEYIYAQLESPEKTITYLKGLGINQDIIDYIISLDKKNASILINMVRQNPNLTINDLQQNIPEKQDVNAPYEYTVSDKYPNINKWILREFRLLRRGVLLPDNEGNKTIIPSVPNQPLSQEEIDIYQRFKGKLDEINDWYNGVQPDISVFSAQEAALASDEWHKMMAGKGEGMYYEPTKPDSIVYGPKWNNPEFDGWTIQKVVSENDLLVEGNRMNHCVGDYCDDVETGHANIYSLRDSQNNPYITMNVDAYGDIEQIQGKSNSDPDFLYKSMIKEFFENNENGPHIQTNVNAFEKMHEESPDMILSDTLETLQIINAGTDDYGRKYVLDRDVDDIALDVVSDAIKQNSRLRGGDDYHGDIVEIPYLLTDIAVKKDLENIATNWKQTKLLQKYVNKISDEVWEQIDDWGYDNREGYPNEDDYETPEEYEEAVEEFEQYKQEEKNNVFKNTIKGGFAYDVRQHLDDLRRRGEIPSYEEMYKQEQELVTSNLITTWYKKAQNNYMSPLELYAQSIGVDPDLFHYMGKGDFGEAYETNDGKVLKITSSPSEVAIAKQLIGKNTAFAQIYDIKEINNYNFILQEKLDNDSDIENKFYQVQNLLEQQGLPIQYLGNLDEDDLNPEDKMLYQELSNFINGLENINRAYRNLGIEASDISPDNLGYDKNGVLKAFDIDDKGGRW